jgi:hypothetical protein
MQVDAGCGHAGVPQGRLAAALELLADCYGVRSPDPDNPDEVLTFLAEAMAAVALDRRTLSATRRGKRE